jgi:hypothetical protein
MAPTINNYDITSVANHTDDNKLVKLMEFVSEPTCSGGGSCGSSAYDFLPGFLILLAVYLVVFFSLKLRGYSTLAAWTSCNIANFVLALLLYPLGIISGQILVISIVLVPLSGMFLWMFEARGG